MKISIFAILLFCLNGVVANGQTQDKRIGNGDGKGNVNETSKQTEKPQKLTKTPIDQNLTITSKPRAVHTEIAKANKIEGTVRLKVTFKKDGSIGKIKVISGLADGLTEQAVEAAKKIKFTPATKKGKSVTVTKTVEYTFTIY
jgi:TonB family protein